VRQGFDSVELACLHSVVRPEVLVSHSCTLETPRWSAGAGEVSFCVPLPVHRRLSVSQLAIPRTALTAALGTLRECGVPAIGVTWERLLPLGLETAIEAVRDSGLLVSSLGWIGGFTGAQYGSWDDAVREARLTIWTAGRLKAQSVLALTGPKGSHIRPHARRLVVDALRELAPFAAANGVRIALQPMHRVRSGKWTFLHSLDETLDVVERVSHPWVGFAYSPVQLVDDEELLSRIPSIAARIASVQLSDWRRPAGSMRERLLPGDGCLPLARHVELLEQAGYRGLYEIDPCGTELGRRQPRSLIAECRRRFEELCHQFAFPQIALGHPALADTLS
jgi:sugar phosphate isomerase/epimerase